ncbi:MAG TPA: universal stress protein, partial [Gemmatimonadaceae bacterium]|nr:universal stress protein [Gemmatimonadaceae bacterium]
LPRRRGARFGARRAGLGDERDDGGGQRVHVARTHQGPAAPVVEDIGDGADVPDVPITTTLLEGAPAAVLAAHLAGGAAELVVMATHRRGEMRRFLLGSVADELVRRATVPVLLVASGEDQGEDPGEGRAAREVADLSRVLVPLDGSSSGAAIIAHAVSVAGSAGVRYRLARVLDPVSATVGPHLGVSVARTDIPRAHEEAERFLQPLVEAMRARGLDVETRVVVAPEPVGAILELAREFDAGLIAMETHGYPRAGRLLLGSVAGRVLSRTDVPVLVHRRAVDP